MLRSADGTPHSKYLWPKLPELGWLYFDSGRDETTQPWALYYHDRHATGLPDTASNNRIRARLINPS